MKQLLLLLTLPHFFAGAQKSDEPIVLNADDYEAKNRLQLPFKNIQVADVRFDKSNIGCVNRSFSTSSFKHYKTTAVLPDSLHRYLPHLLIKIADLESAQPIRLWCL